MVCVNQESILSNEESCDCKYAIDNTGEKYQCLYIKVCQTSFKSD
jgi:hypothetical protein